VVVPSSSGLSKETVLFDAAWTAEGAEHREPMVARINPPHNTVFPDSDFGIEYRVMKALDEGTDVPVPSMQFYEEDKSIMGGEFITMGGYVILLLNQAHLSFWIALLVAPFVVARTPWRR